MQITQISATYAANTGIGEFIVFGLGEDNKLYRWNPMAQKWDLVTHQ